MRPSTWLEQWLEPNAKLKAEPLAGCLRHRWHIRFFNYRAHRGDREELAFPQVSMTQISFFSRDERTFLLFRSSWQIAARELGSEAEIFNRGIGLKNAWRAIRNFVVSRKTRRFVFGTSEICLYSLFSGAKDVFVFTGLGRLLIADSLVASFVRSFLRMTFKGQTLVVLNPQDQRVISELFGAVPILIEGEGYRFDASGPALAQRPIGNGLVVAYVGRLLKSKGVDNLIREFARNALDKWTLLLIGDNDFSNSDSVDLAELQSLIKSSAGRIECLGFRNDVPQQLQGVDFLISLSRREGLPFSALDGVASGAHLILSRVAGHLSFGEFAGVTLTEPDQLGKVFHDIASGSTKFFDFDPIDRRRACDRRFGQATIVAVIKRLMTPDAGAEFR